MILKPKSHALLIGAFFGAASLISAQAASSIVTFSVDMSVQIANATFTPGTDTVSARGTFNGYGQLNLAQLGATSVYTNTVNDTTDANGGKLEYKFFNSNGSVWESPATGNNRCALLPTNNGASLVLSTAFFSDAGTPVANDVKFQVDVSQQIALGIFTNGLTTVDVRGGLNGWNPSAALVRDLSQVRTTPGGLLTTNVYTNSFPVTASPGGAQGFKFVILNGGTVWESPSAVNTDSGGNRYFANTAQTLPVFNFSDQPYAPICQMKFVVDMSVIDVADPLFDHSTVTVNGSFNGWASGIACTNNPNAANTNIYTSAIVSSGAGAGIDYQFRYSNGGTVYDNKAGGGNRYVLTPNLPTTNLPAVFFNDVTPSDVLNVDTVVTFTVNMTNAQGTDFQVYDPNTSAIFINGDFSGWQSWNPLSLAGAGLQCTETVPGSQKYSYTKTFLKNTARGTKYKYSLNGADNEAISGQDHFRYIRSTNGVYAMPLDTFGTQTVEPKFGDLVAGPASGGVVPITWLGYPNVKLQTRTSLTAGTWQNVANTTAGSSTNWATAGSNNQFFRLIQE